MILAVMNNKGGVGKTTTAVNVAAFMARARRRVLVVDLDIQGSAGVALGVDDTGTSPASIGDVMFGGVPFADAVRSTAWGVDVLPSNLALASVDVRLAHTEGREHAVSRALEPARAGYDVVILDCPPSVSLLTIGALVAADVYIVPVQPHYLAMHGLSGLEYITSQIRDGIGTVADMLGIALVSCDYRQGATREGVAMVRQHFGRAVFRTEIRTSVKLVEAPSHGKPIAAYAPTSPPAVQYEALTHEILTRMKKAAK